MSQLLVYAHIHDSQYDMTVTCEVLHMKEVLLILAAIRKHALCPLQTNLGS